MTLFQWYYHCSWQSVSLKSINHLHWCKIRKTIKRNNPKPPPSPAPRPSYLSCGLMETIIWRALNMSALWFPNAPPTPADDSQCQPSIMPFTAYSGIDHQKPNLNFNDSFKIDLLSKPSRVSPPSGHCSLPTMKMSPQHTCDNGPQSLRNQQGAERTAEIKTSRSSLPISLSFPASRAFHSCLGAGPLQLWSCINF